MTRRTSTRQFSFASGMLDAAMEARADLRAYHAGARELTNVIGMARGGVATRGGFRTADAITTPGGMDNIRLARFAFSFEAVYLIVFAHRQIRIFRDGVRIGFVNDGYDSDELPALAWTQSLDTMILVHPAHRPRRLLRIGGGASWRLAPLPLSEIPGFNYGAAAIGNATPSGRDGDITIDATEAADFAGVRFGDGEPGFRVRLHGGLVKLTHRLSATRMAARVIQKLEAVDAVRPGFWSVEEDAWSDRRGWPGAANLFQGRLYFGAVAARPQTIWGSRAGDFFNFGTTAESLDDEAVEMTMDNDQVAAIAQIFAGNELFAFTSGGVFVNGETPVSPASFFMRRHSDLPASPVRPVEIDGAVIFVSRGADNAPATCNELIYDEAAQSYVAEDLGLLAGRLIDNPVALAARRGAGRDAANHLLAVNRDGAMAVLNTRRGQNIAAWTRLTPADDGKILDVVTTGADIWCLIERRPGGRLQRLIERLDPDCLLDSAVTARPETAPPTRAWAGLALHEGARVRLIGDGVDLGEAIVADNRVTTPVAVSALYVGLPFDWAVETMPVAAMATAADGALIGRGHRLLRAGVRVGRASRFRINGRAVAGVALNDRALDAPPPEFSGMRTVRFLGRDGGRRGGGATVRVTGDSTAPASILSITTEVAE